MSLDVIAICMSGASLIVSGGVAYLTLLRKGHVRMTRPSVVFLGPDAGNRDTNSLIPKVYLRTMLYSTAKQGAVIASMFVKVTRGETVQTFNIWVYGEDKLYRGSGLFIGEQGVVCNHHFLPLRIPVKMTGDSGRT